MTLRLVEGSQDVVSASQDGVAAAVAVEKLSTAVGVTGSGGSGAAALIG